MGAIGSRKEIWVAKERHACGERLINENSHFLKPKQTKIHIEKLNIEGKYSEQLEKGNVANQLAKLYLDSEWEIVLLNVFSKFGNVIHEKEFKKWE